MLPGGSDRLILQFGEYRFDARSGELSRNGIPVRLQPQPAKVLAVLTSRPGELITRDDLRREVWGSDTHVDFEQGLNYCIKQIRVALDEDTDRPRYIETLPRRGYRFIERVTQVTETAGEVAGASPDDLPHRSWRLGHLVVVLFVSLGLAGALGYLVWPRFFASRPVAPARILLAVLPLQNLDNEAQDYLSEGLTEELITQLGRINPGSLGVIARTSVSRYKRTAKSIVEIGRELHVDYILEGSTRQAAGRVRLNVQLIRVSDQAHLWAEAYERDMEDILELEADLAQTVARQIAVKLAPREWQGFAARRVNPLARDAYLRGRYQVRTLSGAGVLKGMEFFEKAIAIDPDFAPAHAGLAESYYALSNMQLPPAEAMKKARLSAERATAIDPMLAEGHLALALVHAFYEWDWAAGEKEFESAIDLGPELPDASVWYSIFLANMGRLDESRRELERAHQIDPFRADIISAQGLPPYLAGQYAEALAYSQKAVLLDPNFYLAHIAMGTTYEAMGRYREAAAAFQKARQLDDAPVILAFLGRTCAKSGNRREATRVLAELRKMSTQRHVSPYDLALLYEALGLKEQALEQLQKAYETRAEGIVALRVDPRLRSLRPEPAFKHLLRLMAFPEIKR